MNLSDQVDKTLRPLLEVTHEASKRLETLDKTIVQIQTEIDQIGATVTARREYEAACEDLERLEQELAQTSARVAELQRRHVTQQERCGALEAALVGTRRNDREAASRLQQLAARSQEARLECSRLAQDRADAESRAPLVATNLLDEALTMAHKALVDYRVATSSAPHAPEWHRRRRQDPHLHSLLDMYEHERAAYRAAEHRHDHDRARRHAQRMDDIATQVNSEFPGALDALYMPDGLETFVHNLELFYAPAPDGVGIDIALPTAPTTWTNLADQPSLTESSEGIVATHLCWALARTLDLKLVACTHVVGEKCVLLRCPTIRYDEVPSGACVDLRLPSAPPVRLEIKPLPEELLEALRNACAA